MPDTFAQQFSGVYPVLRMRRKSLMEEGEPQGYFGRPEFYLDVPSIMGVLWRRGRKAGYQSGFNVDLGGVEIPFGRP